MALNPVTRAALNDAILEDHACTDTVGCDIEVARKHGFILASAHLLLGATETPTVDAVIARYNLVIPDVHSSTLQGWREFHDKNKRQCRECEAFMYADPDEDFEPNMCTNCLAEFPDPQLPDTIREQTEL